MIFLLGIICLELAFITYLLWQMSKTVNEDITEEIERPFRGKTKFYEPFTDKERFEKAKNIGDLL